MRLRRWRILIPLAVALLVMITISSFLLYWNARTRMTNESAKVFGRIPETFARSLENDASLLGAVLKVLTNDSSLRLAAAMGIRS